MKRVLSEEVTSQRTRAPLPEPSVSDDPLRRLQAEMQPFDDDVRRHVTTHPEEIVITGLPVMCPKCGARRDWMVVCDRHEVSIRCRCAHQWIERELTRTDFEAMIEIGGHDYPSLESAARAVGYDGTLAGTYLEG